ncbi:MAG: CpsD/CapB family tyrosine-protein kinase [Panacagrimonas sp.]
MNVTRTSLTVDDTHPRLPALDEPRRLSQALARRSGLTDSDLKRVGVVQDQLGLGFIEAAMRLGLITQSDLDAVLADDRAPDEVAIKANAKPSAKLLTAHDPFDPYSENIRALRTELIVRTPAQGSNVLAIVSPGAQEGRSRLAAELAIAFSQLSQPTLLVDSDLRRSTQHELFSADNDEGLAQALSEGRAPKVQGVIGLPFLSLLTAGPRAGMALEILSDPMFGEMMQGWRRRYRHVIIDTPAVSEFSDGLAVAANAGRALVLSRMNHTRLARSKDMVRRLESARAEIVGGVLNRF